MDKLNKAIKRTIEYGEEFGVRYNRSDIKERLISSLMFAEKDVDRALGMYLISSSKSLVAKGTFSEKMKKAKRLATEIGAKFSDILCIGVTGSVAAGYPPAESDIDLMVVTKNNRLWLTRLLLRWWIWRQRIPHRRYGRKESTNEFCFNLWLEESALKVPKSKQNLRNAMDTILMKPVFDRPDTYREFLKKNKWVKKFVATGYQKKINELNPPARHSLAPSLDKEGRALFLLDSLFHMLADSLNWLVFWPQWWYMKQKIGGGLVDRKRAFFHPSR